MKNKGQAAMEFLMTYGWAILAAIIAIGVLAYFGVFNPGRFVQDTVVIQPPFGQNAFQISSSGGISIDLQNGAGETVTISSVSITGCGTYAPNPPLVMQTGTSEIINVVCSPPLVSGNTFRGDITIEYNKTSARIGSTTSGTITAKVKP